MDTSATLATVLAMLVYLLLTVIAFLAFAMLCSDGGYNYNKRK